MAHDARRGWAALPTGERSRHMLAFADRIQAALPEYVAAERAGTGKPVHEAEGEVLTSVDVLRFYAGAVRAALSPAPGHHLPDRESWVRWEPLGVVAAIVPWNYPIVMSAWRLGPALAAGNAVILKPAESTPDSALLLARDAAETLGPGVLTALPGDRTTGRRLVESPVEAVAFTGSIAGGRDVAARAGLRRISLELGGNCPAVVLPGAPAHTYAELTGAATYNAGQSCAAPARVITLRANYAEVVDRLAEAMAQRPAGMAFGPLNNADQIRRFDDILSRTGAGTSTRSGLALDGASRAEGYWAEGRILADLEPDDPAVVTEVFGPCLTVQAADDIDHAIRLANGVDQALAGSVWGAGEGQLLAVARALDAGEVWVNCVLEQCPELPHGGRGASGHGTDLSVLALTEFQRPKTVTVRVV
ncbi:gamma-aminobutyraldehyde dehydrogenase [Plantactinospora mayteni]|uniref:Gamma-aminobutyraldehyde dehydrogenase n=1 Tax=Plantactinospora mayteni TaxID=566021 RepID=A0ABQ4EIG0_9ACTN|nr:gamma-aminobutyraldehyde dehydrogenase [Plantactinospora mayteni]